MRYILPKETDLKQLGLVDGLFRAYTLFDDESDFATVVPLEETVFEIYVVL